MAVIIPDEKKEEIRDTADLVEVVEDYVKLKRSGRNWKGLCPFHDEKTPSFNVTPELGIYKCFGCGESGDVFNFVMEMEGIGFVEAMRTLADRFGISLPEAEEDEEADEEHHLREGIYHALKYAGVFYHQQLMKEDEARKARSYLQERGYNHSVINKYGLGYAPAGGELFYKAAIDSGLNEQYLLEAGLIKPSNRGSGFYDTFRGRLMFPIFNPTGKVIAFAGRVLGKKKAAKYINSPQTKVYNKSEVLYGVNFAKNEIRKNNEVILVEGYTDVISLQQEGIKNVLASSGTSLTSSQLRLIKRYGDSITMIYDSDVAGQKAMKRGINLALAEGLDVKLLELPEGEDPDSFMGQFGRDSFMEMKKEEEQDFLSYLINHAKNQGQWEQPAEKKNIISEALQSIAHIPDKIARETYVQHLNRLTKVGDRALMEELGNLLQDLKQQEERSRRRKERRAQAKTSRRSEADSDPRLREQPHPADRPAPEAAPPQKRPSYEKELIRLMLLYDRTMIDYIGSHCSEAQFEDDELRTFYGDIIDRYKEEQPVSVDVYAAKEHPYPHLVGEIVLQQHEVSERHAEKVGVQYKRDKNPYATAKGALKALRLHYLDHRRIQLQQQFSQAEGEERREVMKMMQEVGRQRTILQKSPPKELFPDPESEETQHVSENVFTYTMKEEKD